VVNVEGSAIGSVLLRSTRKRATAWALAPVLTEGPPDFEPCQFDTFEDLPALAADGLARCVLSVNVLGDEGLLSSVMYRLR
jgi:hypothetical protein